MRVEMKVIQDKGLKPETALFLGSGALSEVQQNVA